ncbi:MAG: zinc-ribbon domain-containing protein [Chloroflexota bacterium]|nr:zinc-ribbon domain-containing protein [Chloroflexota bacterium]
MTQNSPRPCPRCGIPVTPGQRFCSNCGATIDISAADPTAHAEISGQGAQIHDMSTESVPPPIDYGHGVPVHDMSTISSTAPPPPQTYGQQQPTPPYQQYTPPAQNMQQGFQQPPPFTQPQKDSSKSVLGQIGCGVGIVILLIVLVCGAGSFVLYRVVTSNNTTLPGTTTSQNGNSPSNANVTPTPAPVITTPIGSTITYKSVDITIISVQQSTSFVDDTDTSNSPYVVRLQLKEHNTSAANVFMGYSQAARLLLPDGTTVTPANTSSDLNSVPQATDHTGWLDFPLATNVKPEQLSLQIGTNTEAKIKVPLTAGADLTQYKTKMASPNKNIQYAGLTWTITSAIIAMSNAGTQADAGKRFVTLTLKVDNATSQKFDGYDGNYMRLQAGGTTASPDGSSNFPSAFAAQSTGTTGTVVFIMPDNTSSFTLILLAQPNNTPPISQASTTFQIP